MWRSLAFKTPSPVSSWARLSHVASHTRLLTTTDTKNDTNLSKAQQQFPELHESDFDAEGNPDYVKLILTSRVYDVVEEAGSPLTRAINMSHKLNTNLFLKREDLLPVFSFKLRGAHNMIAQLHSNPKTHLDGVIACSAGNHAQGVAYSANRLGIASTIVMPTATPSIKYKNVSRLGSQVVLYGEDFDSAKRECDRLSIDHNLTNIPPFNHPYVIAGQGTIALELTRQIRLDKLDAVFVPVGGGGLIAGIGAYLKKIAPHVKIIGVETYDANALYASQKSHTRETLDSVGVFADGTAVKILGEETWRLCKDVVDDVVLVLTDELCAAIKDIFEDTRLIVEPSGALSVAGVTKYIENNNDVDHRNKNYVSILSGANMNFDRLRFVSERAVLGEGKEASLVVSIPERPGEFSKLQSIVDPRAITEFSYRYNNSDPANIFVSFNVASKDDLKEIINRMRSEEYGYDVEDISNNEVAKSHGRYLIGGSFTRLKPNKIVRERVYQFEFPERPGALTTFLKTLKPSWDITLFNYRNHGNDVGKVLCGIVTPEETSEEDFQAFLKTLGYRFYDETENVVYKKFLN